MPVVHFVSAGGDHIYPNNNVAWRNRVRWSVTHYDPWARVHNWNPNKPHWPAALNDVSGWLFQHVVTEVANVPNYSNFVPVTRDADYWEMWVVLRRGTFRNRKRIVLPCSTHIGEWNFHTCQWANFINAYNDVFTVGHGVLENDCLGYQDFYYRKTGEVFYYGWSKESSVTTWVQGADFKPNVWGFLLGSEDGPGIAGGYKTTRKKTIHVVINPNPGQQHTINVILPRVP